MNWVCPNAPAHEPTRLDNGRSPRSTILSAAINSPRKKALRRGAYPAWGVYANVYMGMDDTRVEYRIDDGEWRPMRKVLQPDPRVMAENHRDDEADAILQRAQDGVEKPKPKVLFEAGQMVRVTDGPFNDFNGVVEEVNYEKSRLRVAVLIFGRSTPVELEFGQVEKA